MGVIDNLLARIGYTKGAPTGAGLFAPRNNGFGGAIPTYPMTFGGWPDRNPNQQTLTTYQAFLTSWVYSDVQVLSREFQAPALTVKELEGEGTTDVSNHPLERLFSRPNPYMGKSFLMSFWLHSMLLKGKAAFYFAPTGNSGEIGEIWPLPPAQFRAVGDAKDFISGYEFKSNADSKPILIDPRYICYSRLVNPANLREGLAPLDAAMNAVMTDQAQAKWAQNFFTNKKAIPDAIVQLPRDIQEGEFQTIKTEILEGLFGNGIGIGFARSGDMDIKAFGFDMQKVQQIEARKFGRDEIDRVFGIPEGYWTAQATRANADHAGDAVLSNVVHPYHVMLAEDLTAQVLPEFYGEQFVAEFEDIRPRNVDLELRKTDRRVLYWTVDELRAEDGLDPIGGAKDPKTNKEAAGDARGKKLVAEIGPGLNALPAPVATNLPADAGAQPQEGDTTSPNAAPVESVQQSALNGAQVQALVDLVQAVSAQQLPAAAAIEIIANAFPTIRRDSIQRMIDAAQAQPPPTVEPVQPTQQPPTEEPAPNAVQDEQQRQDAQNAPAKSMMLDALSAEAYADLERWQTKALKAIKSGKPAAVKFESEHIPARVATAIGSRLMRGDDVRGVFAAVPFMKREPTDALSQDEQVLYDALEPVLSSWGGDVSTLIRKDGKIDYDAIGASLRQSIAPILQAHVLAQLSQRNTTYGIDSGDAGVNAATAWAKDYPFELVRGLTDTTREVVQRAVADYTATLGMTRGELEARLQPAFGALRAESIAVTETTRAASAATTSYQTGLTELGYKSVRVWGTLADETTCDICGPLNGKTEDEWGDVDDAPAHPRCRCAVTVRILKDE